MSKSNEAIFRIKFEHHLQFHDVKFDGFSEFIQTVYSTRLLDLTPLSRRLAPLLQNHKRIRVGYYVCLSVIKSSYVNMVQTNGEMATKLIIIDCNVLLQIQVSEHDWMLIIMDNAYTVEC